MDDGAHAQFHPSIPIFCGSWAEKGGVCGRYYLPTVDSNPTLPTLVHGLEKSQVCLERRGKNGAEVSKV